MRLVVIAFATTGKDPKAGARISELAAIEQDDGRPSGRTLHLTFATAKGSVDESFAQQFDTLNNLVGDAKIVVFDAALWRRFLRPELRHVNRPGSRRLLSQTLDIRAWARQRFPKQRNDLSAIARKLGVCVSPDADGLVHDVATLSAIATLVQSPIGEAARTPHVQQKTAPQELVEAPTAHQRSLINRLVLCWRVLSGQV